MNRYLKEFFHRGLIFAGFGPIVLGIIYAILQATLTDFSLSGGEVLLSTVSIYLLAFLQAGATVFTTIDHWPLPKVLACHFATVYGAYLFCYLVNTWIPFHPQALLIFTAVFLAIYAAIWLSVYLSVKALQKRLNEKQKELQ